MSNQPSAHVPQRAQSKNSAYIRPLSFSEAFRFTPLTTSPLQPSDQLPLPVVGHRSHHVSLASDEDRKALANIQITPEVQEQMQKLLQPNTLSEFKFKRKPQQNARQSHAQAPILTPLASYVYNGDHPDVNFQSESSKVARIETPARKTNQINGSAYAQNFSLEIPRQPPQPNDTPRPVIQIQQPQDFRREDYAAAQDSPKRRKLQHDKHDAELALRQRTQRELGDHTVQRFQNLLLNLFEVRDRLDAQNGIGHTDAFFEPAHDDDDFQVQLTSTILEKLQSSLKELIDLKRLDDISKEHIIQLRQLCEGPLQRAQTLNLRLSNDPPDEDLSDWLSKLAAAGSGVASASVVILTALGDGATQLSSELLQTIPVILVNAFESCLIPVLEARPDGQSASLFRHASENGTVLRSLLDGCRKLLDQMSTACVQLKEAADCLNSTEFLAAKLIFVQNAPTDKNSALGSKTYERTRKLVMSSLARLFAAFPSDRSPILDEILSSVDKLPSTSRSARQYALGEGKSIMLVSALFLQLVQTSALGTGRHAGGQRGKGRRKVDLDADESDEDDDEDSEYGEGHNNADDAFSQLRDKAEELYTPALRTSQEIVLYLVGKASKVSKTGDSPYRNILDLFIEDLVTLLPLPEWPASQLLLEILYMKMTEFIQHEKAAGVKNMALESLGTMGAAIAASKASAQVHTSTLAKDAETKSEATQALARLANDHFNRGLSKDELLGSDGPFALTCRYYSMQHVQKDSKSLRSRATHSFFLAQLATIFCRTRATEATNDNVISEAAQLLEDVEEAGSESPPLHYVEALQNREAHLAYLLSVLNLPFCRRYELIAQTLLASLASEQAQVRSRSIKSVVTMLETDPSLLDSQDLKIDQYIFPCASDDSALVRDAALSLIAQFLINKPAYEERGIKKLIECTGDGKIGVQKRSIGHLADVYSHDKRPKLKAWIAETFLRRTTDLEESVAELARRTLTDAWFTSNYALAKEDKNSAPVKVAIEALTSHMISTIEHSVDDLPALVTRFFTWVLKTTKSAKELHELLSRISKQLFETIIASNASQAGLQLLVCLAKAHPESIAPGQLSHLKEYLKNFTTNEELLMFKSVLGIFQHVLPRLSLSHQDLLQGIRGDLFKALTKLAVRQDLDDAMSCLRAIENVISNPSRYVSLLKSIIGQVQSEKLDERTRMRLIFLLGSIVKHIDVDKLPLKGQVQKFEAGSAAGFIVDLIFPWAMYKSNDQLRLTALDSLGCICQAWPTEFNKKRVLGLFLECLDQPDGSAPRKYALNTFEQIFMDLGDGHGEADEKKDVGESVQDLKKMGGNDKIQSDSSAISQLATKVFEPIARIALSAQGADLLLAVEIITSMSRHGMFHPKDYAGVFIALQTSDDAKVRTIINKAHAKSHTLHESVWEREYVSAIQEAFRYQLRISDDPAGCKQGKAKLAECFSAVNSSGSKYVKKFVSSIISRLNTDAAKLDISQDRPDHLLFVRFVAQNLAFFDYAKMEDLLHTMLQLEILFSKNGGEISQAIESSLPIRESTEEADLPNGNSEAENNDLVNGHDLSAPKQPPVDVSSIDQDLLKRLTTAACAVTIISETRSHLKRQYAITKDVRATMAQYKQAKENSKAPIKVHGITGDRFWNQTTGVLSSLESPEAMLQRCRDFYQLMNIDEDVLVGEDGEEMQTSVEGDGYMAPPSRGKKRKSTGSVGGTPRKRGRPRKNATPTSRRSSSVSSRDDPDAEFMG